MGLTSSCRGWIQTLIVSGVLSHTIAVAVLYIGSSSIWQQPVYLTLILSVFGAIPEMQRVRDMSPLFHFSCLAVSVLSTGAFCAFAYFQPDPLAYIWIILSLLFIFVSASHLHYAIKVRKEESELPQATVTTVASDETYDQIQKDRLV